MRATFIGVGGQLPCFRAGEQTIEAMVQPHGQNSNAALGNARARLLRLLSHRARLGGSGRLEPSRGNARLLGAQASFLPWTTRDTYRDCGH